MMLQYQWYVQDIRTYIFFHFVSLDTSKRRRRVHSRPLAQLQFRDTSDGTFLISACLDKNPMLRDGKTGDWVRFFYYFRTSLKYLSLSFIRRRPLSRSEPSLDTKVRFGVPS